MHGASNQRPRCHPGSAGMSYIFFPSPSKVRPAVRYQVRLRLVDCARERNIDTHAHMSCQIDLRPLSHPLELNCGPIFAQLTAYTDGMASGSNILLPPVLMVNPFSCCINSARVQQNAKLRWFVRGTSSLCVAWRWYHWIKQDVECNSI